MNFCSDNVTGVAPEIMAALMRANDGAAMPYGEDAITQGLTQRFSDLFEKEVTVFPVATGGAANGLALAAMTQAYGSIYCHEQAHIHVHECGGPEFYTGGAKLISLTGPEGKISPALLADALAVGGRGDVHHAQPAALSLTQATDAGTVYGPAEIQALTDIARQYGMRVHMDGARFANAVVATGVSPAALTWKAGVDILSFGATKNGAMAAEAVVIFDPVLAKDFIYRRKRAGHLWSKHRFLSAQWDAYLTDGLWLRLAEHANRQAQILAQGLSASPEIDFVYPVHANEIFIRLPVRLADRLEQAGFQFYRWPGVAQGRVMIRLVTAFNTNPDDVGRFIAEAAPSLQTSTLHA